MLRDYELALSNYRLISTDYKLDKAWKHYAGIQVAANCILIVSLFWLIWDLILSLLFLFSSYFNRQFVFFFLNNSFLFYLSS